MANKSITRLGAKPADSALAGSKPVRVHIPARRPSRSGPHYPLGSVGANLSMRNYARYLAERYHRYRRADPSFGSNRPMSYAVLFKNIERTFKAPLFFVPETHFPELVDYLHSKIDGTILGKRNRTRGVRNYSSWDEFLVEHSSGSEEALGVTRKE